MTLVWTDHASQRWAERLAPFDPVEEYAASSKVAKRGMERRIAACPAHGEYAKGFFKGIYYLSSPNAVWVMAAPELDYVSLNFIVARSGLASRCGPPLPIARATVAAAGAFGIPRFGRELQKPRRATTADARR